MDEYEVVGNVPLGDKSGENYKLIGVVGNPTIDNSNYNGYEYPIVVTKEARDESIAHWNGRMIEGSSRVKGNGEIIGMETVEKIGNLEVGIIKNLDKSGDFTQVFKMGRRTILRFKDTSAGLVLRERRGGKGFVAHVPKSHAEQIKPYLGL